MNNNDKIIVLDFGSQYNQLITRRIRELGVYSELLPYNTSIEDIKKNSNVRGIIFSGGPNSVTGETNFKIDKRIYDLGIPILGICYGMQLLSKDFGGIVKKSNIREYGKSYVKVDNKSLLFKGLDENQQVWMSHGDEVIELGKDFTNIAKNESCKNSACENIEHKFYGVQFHPEVTNTINGLAIISNFVFSICNAKGNWTMEKFITDSIIQIKNTINDDNVLLGLSGGVDSAVSAVLIERAIGSKLTCMFIDHGLLRKNEVEEVVDTFKNKFNLNIIVINAKKRFLEALKGIIEPEQKRKIIGKMFIDVFHEESQKLGTFSYLAQGTLYTDIIESGTLTAQTIKSHHNVGGLPKDLNFKLIEPLKTLFKDEVRKVGIELGISKEIINRQPFPGPGLGIIIIGEITEEKIKIVQDSDYILRQEIIN
ncbi:MAG: glutamine-hydrolyzing GMP synthase, partial [Erysipelotrichales bacterium]|nr:glutamine-hydrolyzing GMP synthase [Erysipelotrichales bacterium]